MPNRTTEINLCENCPIRENRFSFSERDNTPGPLPIKDLTVWRADGKRMVTGTVGDAFHRTKRFSVGNMPEEEDESSFEADIIASVIEKGVLDAEFCEGPKTHRLNALARLLGKRAVAECPTFNLIKTRED